MSRNWFKRLLSRGPQVNPQVQRERELWEKGREKWRKLLSKIVDLLSTEDATYQALELLKTFSGQELGLARTILEQAIAANPNFLCLLLGEESTEKLRKFAYNIAVELPTQESLVHVLQTGDPRARACAAEALSEAGTVSVLDVLEVAAATDPDPYVRDFAAHAIPKVSQRSTLKTMEIPERPTKVRLVVSGQPHRVHQGWTWSKHAREFEGDIRHACAASGIRICAHPGEDPDITVEIDLLSVPYGLYESSIHHTQHQGAAVVCWIRGTDTNSTKRFELTITGKSPPKLSTHYHLETALLEFALNECQSAARAILAVLPDLILVACGKDCRANKAKLRQLADLLRSHSDSVDPYIIMRVNDMLATAE